MFRLLTALIAVVLAQSVQAEEPDILRRLRAEPLTLLDWGLAQLDRDIARVATQTLGRRAAPGALDTGSLYNRRSNRVTLYVTVNLPKRERTRTLCTAAYGNIVAALIRSAPEGPDAAGWYLLNAFRPRAHYWGNRFEDIGAKLIEAVRLEVSLIPEAYQAVSGDTARVRCSGRLDADVGEIKVDETS